MVKRRFSLILLAGILLSLPALAADDQSTNVAGNWQISWQGRQGARQGTLQFQQNGTDLTGTFQGPRGSAPLSGSLQGNDITFSVKMEGRGRSVTLAFKGTVDGDKMNGTIQPQGGGGKRRGGEGGQGHTWTATRQANQGAANKEN